MAAFLGESEFWTARIPNSGVRNRSHDSLPRCFWREGVQVLRHESSGLVCVPGPQCLEDLRVLGKATPQIVVAILPHFVGDSFVGPAIPQDLAQGEIAAELSDGEMHGLIEPTSGRLPFPLFRGLRIPAQQNEIVQHGSRDGAATTPDCFRFEKLTHPVDIDQPIFLTGANGGPEVEGLVDDAVCRETGQRLDDGSTGHVQLSSQPSGLELRSPGKFASNDLEQDAVVSEIGQGAFLGILFGIFAEEG